MKNLFILILIFSFLVFSGVYSEIYCQDRDFYSELYGNSSSNNEKTESEEVSSRPKEPVLDSQENTSYKNESESEDTDSESSNEISRIELKNGTVLYGVVTGMKKGKYIIETENLGILKIKQKNIKAILAKEPQVNYNTNPAANYSQPSNNYQNNSRPQNFSPPSGDLSGLVNDLKSKMGNSSGTGRVNMGNVNSKLGSVLTGKKGRNLMTNMMNNDSVQGILQDEELMNDIKSKNYQKLMNNPKLKNLMENSDMKELMNMFK